ncbi:MAG: hypothetical protein Q9164_001800 [Protoblastenia rupestris]
MAEAQAPQMGRTASNKNRLPKRNFSTKYTTMPPTRLPEFEMIKPSSTTVGVVVAVTEARPSTSESLKTTPEITITCEDTPKARPRRPTLTIPPKAHISQQERPESPPSIPPPPPRRQSLERRPPSPSEIPIPNSSMDAPAPVRSDSRALTAVEQTPVMRSMFPSYDSSISLAQQQYYPSMDVIPALTRIREAAGPSAYVPHFQHGVRVNSLAPAKQQVEPKESPLRRSESLKRTTSYSRPDELVDLWSIANGQATEGAADTYILELSCEDLTLHSEIITFSASTSSPLYALSASANNNIGINRMHPQDHRSKIPICTSTLFQPTRQDPLITSIFPKLAGLMALDQSSSAAVARKLDRQASQLLQEQAVEQAQEREGTLLLWDCDSGRFCLMHPTLLDNAATTIHIEITPNPTNPEKITFIAPETETPLLCLQMQTLSLTLYTPAIAALPSLYVLDTLITALLTLLLHLHRSCADPATRHIPQLSQQIDDAESTLYFPPPPPSLHSNASKRSLRKQRSGSRLSTFRAPRSVKSTRSLASAYDADKDVELGTLDPSTGHSVNHNSEHKKSGNGGRFWRRQKQPKKVVVDDKEGEEGLPRGTRVVLRVLYWGFGVIYWMLELVVRVLVAVVVGVGRFVTRL